MFTRCLFRIAFFLGPGASCFAQVDRGAIAGTVLDQNSAGIPAAAVTVTNAETGQSVKLVTDGLGNYTANSLIPPMRKEVYTICGAQFAKRPWGTAFDLYCG